MERQQKRAKLGTSELITPNCLEVGSVWNTEGLDSCFDRLRNSFIENYSTNMQQGTAGRSHRIVQSGNTKNGLLIGCMSDGTSSRKKAQCSFGLIALKKLTDIQTDGICCWCVIFQSFFITILCLNILYSGLNMFA